MKTVSYLEGFCKTAKTLGIDPAALLAGAKGAGSAAAAQAAAAAGATSDKVKNLVTLLKAKMDKKTVHGLVGGGLVGGTAGYLLTDPKASQRKKLRNTLLGLGTGAALRAGLSGALKPDAAQLASRKAMLQQMLADLKTKATAGAAAVTAKK